MQDIAQLVKMVNQIADNFSFHEDAVDRIADHLLRFWAPSMQSKLIEYEKAHKVELRPSAREALHRLENG